jgi:tripartite-type tricarboxylate transporter receptor subunit TctC
MMRLNTMRHSNLAVSLGVAAMLVLAIRPADAQSDDFKGRTITIYIGYGAGGGFDYYGRLAARHLGRHIPGSPTVVVSNMPGAGSLRAANYLYAVAPKDGTALGVITPTVALEEMLGTQGVQYKTANFNWVGRIGPNIDVTMTWHTSKVKTLDDARRESAALAASGHGSTSAYLPVVLNNVVGTRFKIVTGYAGANDGMLAMERSETDGAMTSWNTLSTTRQQWLAEKKVNILVQYVPERLKEMPDVPALIELGKTPEDKQILGLYASAATVGKALIAPPDMPAERLNTLRTAFAAMLKDPAFLADVKKNNTEFDPASGEELQRMVAAVSQMSDAMRVRAQKARGM